MLDRRMTLERQGEFQVPGDVVLAKVRRLEQLLQQNHLRTLRRCLAHEFLRARHIGVAIPTAGHLSGRYRYRAHSLIMPSEQHRYAAMPQGLKGGRRARADDFAFLTPDVAKAVGHVTLEVVGVA